ncbi:hypothetical protein LOZ61_002800 [Ophidiomyces ophidiicola]|nr:hypothetical protein LOZ61_002800 [Ophidiomyces ophidiicola]KAI1919685.1 hypothetical protein LOZ64_002193 [Ophidiomyces ophidiicola]KAI1928094.1 hypothetical protein LOZ60_002587 [Ophidiomyces ophidiicola]KAI2004228.1 hypothetical protein LOZ50_004367 [Ophidiomyces ophidiicola]KAI2006133.1 hypothetical protein LOZ49_005131 [Ophidiomyces ophidiicola]
MAAATGDELARGTVRKIDFILLPFLSLLFLVNSLDRSNIGNAETANFTRDAGLQKGDLNHAMAWFFVFFVALQPVGAAAGRKFGMSIWVPTVMSLWGVCTLLHIWVRRRWQLILIRIVLGALEAGFYPTAVSYLSLFYTRYEFGRRLGLFYGSYGVAGALGGLCAFVVFSRFPSDDDDAAKRLDSHRSWKPWQVLFLVEGLLTIVIALVGFLWLPKSAGTAWFLSPEERKCAQVRVAADREVANQHRSETASTTDIGTEEEFLEEDAEQSRRLLEDEQTMTENRAIVAGSDAFTTDAGLSKSEMLSTILFLPMILPILILNIASAIPSTGFSIFLPIVLSSMGLSSPVHSNLLTVPPFLLASITLYLFMHWSDRSHNRFRPILVSLGVIMAGLALTLLLSPPSGPTGTTMLYFCMCLLLSGCFIPSPLTVAWYAGNIPDPGKRAIVLGINGYGNLAGVFATQIFAPKYQEDGFRMPFLITFVIILLSLLGFAGLRGVLGLINGARKRYLLGWSEADIADEQSSGMGRKQSWGEKAPPLVIVGGSLWDKYVRYYVGMGLLGMDAESIKVRRGDEKLTFSYGY